MPNPTPSPESFGVYRLVRLIARGGQGAVYEVVNGSTGGRFAAKVVSSPDPQARDRLRREAELLARCDSHPGVVRVHSYGEAGGHPYLILDLIRGESLEALLTREEKLAPEHAVDLAHKIALALGHMHGKGVVHRDVKPSNVLLDEQGEPHLTDFGLAVARDVERLTQSGAFIGTPLYMSPEQLERGHSVGPQADVYGLGGLLFHMLSGEPPIKAPSVVDLLASLLSKKPIRDVRTVEPSVPAPFAGVVAAALEKDPALRLRDGTELARALERARLGEGPRRKVRRRTLVLGAVALVGILGLVALVAANLGARAAARERDAAAAALEKARDALARAQGRGAGRTAVPEEWRPGLALAREALARAAHARELGLADAAVVASDAGVVACELATFGAGRELERGEAGAALEALDAVPDDCLRDGSRLLRARALVGAGRAREAADLAAALASRASPEVRAQALEAEGDACLSSSTDVRRAAVAFAGAMAGAPKRASALHEKRAVALALASDEAGALAELAAAGNGGPTGSLARLAPVAPALYRRALATADSAAREHDLELASRMAPAPAGLARRAAEAWLDLCLGPGIPAARKELDRVLAEPEPSPSALERTLRPFERAARARSMDPTITFDQGRLLGSGVLEASISVGQ